MPTIEKPTKARFIIGVTAVVVAPKVVPVFRFTTIVPPTTIAIISVIIIAAVCVLSIVEYLYIPINLGEY